MESHPFYDQPIRQNWPRRTARFDRFTSQVEIIFLKYLLWRSQTMSTTDITTFQSLVEIIFQLYPFSTSQFVRIGQGEPSGSTVSHLKLRLFSNYTHFTTSQFVRIGQGEPLGSTVSHLKLRLFSNYTHFTTSQFVRIGQGEPSGSTVSHLKLRLFSLSTCYGDPKQ